MNTLRLPQQSRVPESIPFRRGIFQKNTKITTKRFKIIKYLTFFTTFQKEIIIFRQQTKSRLQQAIEFKLTSVTEGFIVNRSLKTKDKKWMLAVVF